MANRPPPAGGGSYLVTTAWRNVTYGAGLISQVGFGTLCDDKVRFCYLLTPKVVICFYEKRKINCLLTKDAVLLILKTKAVFWLTGYV